MSSQKRKIEPRVVPVSSLEHVLEFLMFYYNGKDDKATNNFIHAHEIECNKVKDSQISRRYRLFKLTDDLKKETVEWGLDNLEELLVDIVDLEAMYGDQGIFANAGIPYSRWASMKRQVVLQMGLCHLREALKMKNDVDEVTIPKKFSYEAYSKTIEELYASQAEHFLIDRASDELHTSYYTSIEELTTKVFVNLSVNKAAKGKNGRKAVVELAVDSDQLPGLVQQNSMKDAAMSLIRFFQRIEEEVLPIPFTLHPTSAGAKDGIHALQRSVQTSRRLSGEQQAGASPAGAAGAGASAEQRPTHSASKRVTPAPASASASANSANTAQVPVSSASRVAPLALDALTDLARKGSAGTTSSAAAVAPAAPVPAPANRASKRNASGQQVVQRAAPQQKQQQKQQEEAEMDWDDAEAEKRGPYAPASPAALTRASKRGAPKSPGIPDSPERVARQENPSRSARARARHAASNAASSTAPAPAAVDMDMNDGGGDADDQQQQEEEEQQQQEYKGTNNQHNSSSKKPRGDGGHSSSNNNNHDLVVARDKLLAYQDRDPLTTALGYDAHASVPTARMSRESLVSSSNNTNQTHRANAAAASASAAAAPQRTAGPKASSERRGSKMYFTDSEADPIEEEDEDEEGRGVWQERGDRRGSAGSASGSGSNTGAMHTLKHLQQNQIKAAAFPARLESPRGSAHGSGVKRKPLKRIPKTRQVRVKWTYEQEEMLREAVDRYGVSNWAQILLDPEYSITFAGRTNINLKDKWRNLMKLEEKYEQEGDGEEAGGAVEEEEDA